MSAATRSNEEEQMKARTGLALIAVMTALIVVMGCAAPVAEQPAPAAEEPAAAPMATEAVSEEAEEPAAEEAEDNVIKFGASLAISGAVSREGNFLRDGYEYWKDLVNSRGGIQVGDKQYQVEIIYYDDQSDADTGARLTEKLITEDNVDFLLGPFSSGIQINTSAVAERYGVITIAPLANSPSIYERGFKYIFSVLPPATKYLHRTLEMAMEQDPQPETIAIMARDDPFGTAVAAGAAAKAEELGLEVVYNEPYPPDATDVSSALTTIGELQPDILLASTLFADALLITRQAKDLQICPEIMGFSVGPAIPDFPNELGEDANYIFGAEWWLPTLGWEDDIIGSAREFAEDFEAEYGYTPGYHTASGVATGEILQIAIERAGTLDTEAVRQELLNFDDELFWGPTAWDETGQNIKGASVAIQIQDGEVVAVWPPEAAEADPIHPFVCWTDR
jgi:branched-chain amino acid transport system substrate-binding protein